jgi:hypothetical protein
MTELPERCVIVVDASLPAGKAANAAAVLALTLGQRHPGLVGADLLDANGTAYPGLIPVGISVLTATVARLTDLHAQLVGTGIDCVVFPAAGQQTTDYAGFLAVVATQVPAGFAPVGLALAGPKKLVRKLTGDLALLG